MSDYEKINETLKGLNILKDVKKEYNAAICIHCKLETVTVIDGNNFGICFPCHIAIEDERMRRKLRLK